MRGLSFAATLALAADVAQGANVTSNCYESTPSNRHYTLKWKAQGHTFFDDWEFDTGHGATNGAAQYLDKSSGFAHGVLSTTDTSAKIHVGKAFHTDGGPRRYSAKISTKARYKHFLQVMKYKHAPFGLGIWPAYWMLGDGHWPDAGETDILEYASHRGQRVGVHVGSSNHCQLSKREVTKCGEMEDGNNMGYNCYTNYGTHNTGCAPTTFAGQRPPEFWSENPGAFATEWTERYMKVYYFPESEIPDDIDTDTPRPETWSEKYVISYFPFAKSNEVNPGSCPNPQDIFKPQKLILNIELCGDWAGQTWEPWDQDPYASEWRGKRDRGECAVKSYHTASDCCTNYLGQSKMDSYIHAHAYWDISYLKVFELHSGPAPPPPPSTRRRRSAPPPSPGTCAKQWIEDTDCDGQDISNHPAATAEECCESCSKTVGCAAFTHNVFDGHLSPTCYLKKSCESSKRLGKRGCTSGTVDGIPAPPPTPTPPGKCGGNYFENTDCYGADITDFPAATPDECCDRCSGHAGCAAFTHNTADGHGAPHCYLKKSCSSSAQSRAQGCTSGAHISPDSTRRRRTAPPPSPTPSGDGCCSWADNNDCGQTTDYCKANADNCKICGGHWVPKHHPPSPPPSPTPSPSPSPMFSCSECKNHGFGEDQCGCGYCSSYGGCGYTCGKDPSRTPPGPQCRVAPSPTPTPSPAPSPAPTPSRISCSQCTSHGYGEDQCNCGYCGSYGGCGYTCGKDPSRSPPGPKCDMEPVMFSCSQCEAHGYGADQCGCGYCGSYGGCGFTCGKDATKDPLGPQCRRSSEELVV